MTLLWSAQLGVMIDGTTNEIVPLVRHLHTSNAAWNGPETLHRLSHATDWEPLEDHAASDSNRLEQLALEHDLERHAALVLSVIGGLSPELTLRCLRYLDPWLALRMHNEWLLDRMLIAPLKALDQIKSLANDVELSQFPRFSAWASRLVHYQPRLKELTNAWLKLDARWFADFAASRSTIWLQAARNGIVRRSLDGGRDSFQRTWMELAEWLPTAPENTSALKRLAKRLNDAFGGPEQRSRKTLVGEIQGEEMHKISEPGLKCVAAPRLHFAHATPEDEHFVPPASAWARLHGLAADPKAGVLAVTGFAGLGKTSLIAAYLKERAGELARARDGVFYWSLDEDPNVDHLIDWMFSCGGVDASAIPPRAPFEALLALLGERSLILVLDGLQVHQQASLPRLWQADDLLASWPIQSLVGSVMDARLRRLLSEACQGSWPSLVLVTSRYRLPDLHRWLGTTYRELNPDHLKLGESQAADLLRSCSGHPLSDEDCRELWLSWDGFPLGLRMTAEAIKLGCRNPLDHFGLDSLPAARRQLFAKLQEFYESQLSAKQRSLLGVISLFRAPVSVPIIALLAKHLLAGREDLVFGSQDELLQELRGLCDNCLVTRQIQGEAAVDLYACHPALREGIASSFWSDFFRCDPIHAVIEESQTGPSLETRQVARLMYAVISCLVDVGEYARADEVLRDRLEDGWFFLRARDLQVGALCLLEFVRDEERRRACEESLSEERLVHYLRMAGMFLLLAGDATDAAAYFAAVTRRTNSREATRIMLNHSFICSLMGDLHTAESLARRALELTQQLDDSEGQRHCLCCLAHALSVQGRVGEADRLFRETEEHFSTSCGPGAADGLNEADAILWGWHLLRTGKAEPVEELMQAELRRNPQYEGFGIAGSHAPLCQWLLAKADLCQGRTEQGLLRASAAETTFRSQQALLGLPLALLAKAEAYRRIGRRQDAERTCQEARSLAVERELKMVHGESLALLARIFLDNALSGSPSPPKTPDAAEDDQGVHEEGFVAYELDHAMEYAKHALVVAKDCLEIRRDAYLVVAEVAKAEGDPMWEEYHSEYVKLAERLLAVEAAAGQPHVQSRLSRSFCVLAAPNFVAGGADQPEIGKKPVISPVLRAIALETAGSGARA